MPRVRSSPAELVFDVLTQVDVLTLQALCRAFCRRLGACTAVEWAVTIAASEAASNAVHHAGGGRITLTLRGDHLVLEAVDPGPGIDSLAHAMRDHVSGGVDLRRAQLAAPPPSRGTGLGAIARFMDELDVDSAPGRGTRLTATKRLA